MALGERIKACRQEAGMSQEKVAELVGVSRQAVTKWEAGQSAPNTENLFKLAEIFGTRVDLLLAAEAESEPSPAEQVYYLYKMEEARKAAARRQRRTQNARHALLAAAFYLAVYLLGRALWCGTESSVLGWLFTARPSGAHSYLYGWLLSSGLFRYAAAVSVLPALFGKYRFSRVTCLGFALGLAAGILFGEYPAGAAIGHSHYGWAIWGAAYLASLAVGLLAEKRAAK